MSTTCECRKYCNQFNFTKTLRGGILLPKSEKPYVDDLWRTAAQYSRARLCLMSYLIWPPEINRCRQSSSVQILSQLCYLHLYKQDGNNIFHDEAPTSSNKLVCCQFGIDVWQVISFVISRHIPSARVMPAEWFIDGICSKIWRACKIMQDTHSGYHRSTPSLIAYPFIRIKCVNCCEMGNCSWRTHCL